MRIVRTIFCIILFIGWVTTSIYADVISIDGMIDIRRMETEQMAYDLYCNSSTAIFSPCPLTSDQQNVVLYGATDIVLPHANSADHAATSKNASQAGTQTGTCEIANNVEDLKNDMFRNYSGTGNPSCTQGGALEAGKVIKYVYRVDRATSARYAGYSEEATRAVILNNTVAAVPGMDIYSQVDNGDGIINQYDAKGEVEWVDYTNYSEYALYYHSYVLCNDGKVIINPDGTVKFHEGAGIVGRDIAIINPGTPEWSYYQCGTMYPVGIITGAHYVREKADTAAELYTLADTHKGGNTIVYTADSAVAYNVGETDSYGRTLQEILNSSEQIIHIWKIDNYQCSISWTEVPDCQGYVETSSRTVNIHYTGGPKNGTTEYYTCTDLQYQDGTDFIDKLGTLKKCYLNQASSTDCNAEWISTRTGGFYSMTECTNLLTSICPGGTVTTNPGCPVPDTFLNSQFYIASKHTDQINVNYIVNYMCSNLNTPPEYFISDYDGNWVSFSVTTYPYCQGGNPVPVTVNIR
jgi:hypothetical protein